MPERVLSVLSCEFEMISESRRQRFFKNDHDRGGVFDCYSGAIKNDDVRFVNPPPFFSRYNFRKLRVNIFFPH